MRSWGKALGFGFLVWLVPFVVAVIFFGLHESSRPLFESIMAVTVTGTAVAFGLLYMKSADSEFVRESIRLGILWLVVAIAIDAPLMLFGGPMQMTVGQYTADIGVTYLSIPVVTWCIGIARSWS
ncbi:MAG: hypothetical protein BMS9Abin05_0976 [Rhodothermia bacterium]|nr:MAG: hypothetical protein BMS9Abin05_0976 [Rhodothermia bacterium]